MFEGDTWNRTHQPMWCNYCVCCVLTTFHLVWEGAYVEVFMRDQPVWSAWPSWPCCIDILLYLCHTDTGSLLLTRNTRTHTHTCTRTQHTHMHTLFLSHSSVLGLTLPPTFVKVIEGRATENDTGRTAAARARRPGRSPSPSSRSGRGCSPIREWGSLTGPTNRANTTTRRSAQHFCSCTPAVW